VVYCYRGDFITVYARELFELGTGLGLRFLASPI
jgi:hypothetical protein